jgi:hypothetical protein
LLKKQRGGSVRAMKRGPKQSNYLLGCIHMCNLISKDLEEVIDYVLVDFCADKLKNSFSSLPKYCRNEEKKKIMI